MVGRNDIALVAALQDLAQAAQHQPNVGRNDVSRVLDTFQRNHPPIIKGKNDPEGAQEWLKEIERIFRVMDCFKAQELHFGTHMLAREVDDWWVATHQRLDGAGEAITQAVFLGSF